MRLDLLIGSRTEDRPARSSDTKTAPFPDK